MKRKTKNHHHPKLPFHTVASLKERLSWFINIRWIAVIAILISVPFADEMFNFELPFPMIIIIGVILISMNIIYFFIARYYPFKHEYQELYFAEIQIISDLIIISLLIHFSGGIGNPFYFLYIVHVILSGILFPGIVLPYFNAVTAALLLTIWTLAEHFNLIQAFYLRGEPMTFPLTVVALASFYITDFAGIYIINNFMGGYRALKRVIDEKNIMLRQSMKERNKAFRYAAHELKAPMIAVQSYLAVIKELYAGDLKPEVYEMIIKADNRLLQIINMIKETIAITQYNLGMQKPDYENVNFNEWLKTAVLQHKSYAVQKNINLCFKENPGIQHVVIDIIGMEKIVGNLVNNALRYTHNGGSVVVECFPVKNTFGFSVTDSGIGIEEDDLDKIFEEFYRGKNAKEMERIGTGLGLNLVKEIVELYDGEISVCSIPGKGSTFTVLFNLNKTRKKKKEPDDELVLNFE